MKSYIRLDEEQRKLIFMVDGKKMTVRLRNGQDVDMLRRAGYFDKDKYFHFSVKPIAKNDNLPNSFRQNAFSMGGADADKRESPHEEHTESCR